VQQYAVTEPFMLKKAEKPVNDQNGNNADEEKLDPVVI
jgi:hypothetical protein